MTMATDLTDAVSRAMQIDAIAASIKAKGAEARRIMAEMRVVDEECPLDRTCLACDGHGYGRWGSCPSCGGSGVGRG